MKLLLDTHAWLWFYLGDARLSTAAQSAILEPANSKFVSAASLWEIAIKVSIGKYSLRESFDELIQHSLVENGFELLPIEPKHAAAVASLKFLPNHKDPFDRLLIAQASVDGLSVVSGDADFAGYGVPLIW